MSLPSVGSGRVNVDEPDYRRHLEEKYRDESPLDTTSCSDICSPKPYVDARSMSSVSSTQDVSKG